MKTEQLEWLALILTLFVMAGCGAGGGEGAGDGAGSPITPSCCDEVGVRDTPFSTTYLFQFRTGSVDLVDPNPDRLLQLVSQADIMTLKGAASPSQLVTHGLISGTVLGPQGPIQELALKITDADGNVVGSVSGPDRNLFYNSLGRVPDFLFSDGTGSEGTFTLFNAPPGELFFQTVRGGRGHGRITSFPAAISLGKIDALPVFPEKVGLFGVVLDAVTGAQVPNATVSVSGIGKTFPASSDGLFVAPPSEGPPTQGEFFFRLSAPRFWETLRRVDTDLQKVLRRREAFDPLLVDNLFIFSEDSLKEMAGHVGITLDPAFGVIYGKVEAGDGSAQPHAVATPLDAAGKALSEKAVRVFYFGGNGEIDPSLTETTIQGGFILFIDSRVISPGEIFLYIHSESITLPPVRSSGLDVAYSLPGKVFVQRIPVVAVQNLPGGSPDDAKSFLSVPIEGKVKRENGDGVQGAEIKIVGSGASAVQSAADGGFLFNQGTTPDEIAPLLANSHYTAGVSKAGSLTTYQTFSTGPAGGRRDFLLLDAASLPSTCPEPGAGILSGTVRDRGLIEPVRAGRAAEGISLKALRPDGTEAGRVVFLDRLGNPLPRSTTDDSGRFVICGLPPLPKEKAPPLYLIQVTSPEDSGTFLTPVYPDAVTLLSFEVNKALPREVPMSGRVIDFFGPEEGASVNPVGGANIAVLGTDERLFSESDGRYLISLDTFGRFLFRSEKPGYLPAYHYQMESQRRTASLPAAWMISKEGLSKFSDSVATPISSDSGIVAGKVVSPGFTRFSGFSAFTGDVQALHPFYSKVDDNADPDLLALSLDGTVSLFLGDGRGGLRPTAVNQTGGISPAGKLQGGAPIETINSIQASEWEDFNRDGALDLAVVGNNKVLLFWGERSGGFQEGRLLPLPPGAGISSALDKADLNGDGFQDLIIGLKTADGAPMLVRLINQTGGSFSAETGDPIGSCGSNPTALSVLQGVTGGTVIAVADLSKGLCLLTFDPDGTLLPTRILATPPIKKLLLNFLNSDPIEDLVIVHQNGIGVLLGTQRADGPLPPLALIPTLLPPGTFQPKDAVLLDTNKDNRPDLILVGEGDGGGGVLLGQGDGTFAAPIRFSREASRLAAIDLDGDLKEDLIVSSRQEVVLYRGADVPKEGVSVVARNEAGSIVGSRFYLDQNGAVIPGATATDGSGRFIVLNVPPALNPQALTMVQVTSGGSGNGMVTTRPGGLSSLYLRMNPSPPPEILVKGAVINPSAGLFLGLDVSKIKIHPLGTEVRALSGEGGLFQMPLGANSEYVIKLEP